MICKNCQQEKPDVMQRLAAKGQEKLDGAYCVKCCVTVLGRKWMEQCPEAQA